MRGCFDALGRLWVLNRRFLCRPSFLVILLLPPLLALGLSAFAAGEKGILTVALYPGGDPLAAGITENLTDSGVLRIRLCASPEEARERLDWGEADTAWMFAEDLAGELARYAAGKRAQAVTVVEREDNVFLMLSRERLYAALYPDAAAAIRTRLLEAQGAEDAKITIDWGSSAWELGRWVMSGKLDLDTLTVEYADCVFKTLTYGDDGELVSEVVGYENGTGRIVFHNDGTFTWKGDQSEQEDLVFEWSFVPPSFGIDYLALVNKLNALPDGWEDALETVTVTNSVGDEVEVEAKAYAAYELLKADLEEHDGIYLELDSARRSVAAQQDIMDRFTEKYGADYAAKTVAQPGYSEHHTGLALDLYFKLKNDDGSFTDVYYNEDMVQYPEIWAKIHAKLARYGFILRYLEGREHITGYGYEPWHIRYLNDPDIAAEIMEADITLEEYLSGEKAPELVIDYGTSELYTKEELDEAIVQIKCRFAGFGCELHSISYAGDEANNAENLAWLNELDEGKGYTQVCAFLSDFHTPADAGGAWEPDTEYTAWQWWLARTEDGGWQLLTFGY